MRKLLTLLFIGVFIVSFICCDDKEEIIPEEIIPEPTIIKQPEGYYFKGEPNDQTKQLIPIIYQAYVTFGPSSVVSVNGNPIEFKGLLPTSLENTFIFDTEGKLIEYEIDSELSFYFSYENNNLVGEATNDVFKWKLVIDNKLNLIYFCSEEISSGNISGKTYEYDVQKRLLKEKWWQDGIVVESVYYKYKDNGNVIKTFNTYNEYSRWFEYNSDTTLVWSCIVIHQYDDNPENDRYELKWYNDNSIKIREEVRTVSDSVLLWFNLNIINELGEQRYYAYSIEKDFGINLDSPLMYRYNGDTILSKYIEMDENSDTLKHMFSTGIGNSENDITKYYFLHVMSEFDNQGNEIAEYHYYGDFRYNIVEYNFGNYEYNETHGKIMQRTRFDTNNIPVYNFLYEYEYNTFSEEYDFFKLNCFDAQTGELLWYYDNFWIKRNPDGSLY